MQVKSPELAGLYITDRRIYAVIGTDNKTDQIPAEIFSLDLDFTQAPPEPFFFSDFESAKLTIDAACKYICELAPNLKSVGVSCYGPFARISREDRDHGHNDYSRLQSTSHGELSGCKISEMVEDGLAKHISHMPLITVETDVGADAMGIIYELAHNLPESEFEAIKGNSFAVIRADNGIGGAFMRVRDTQAWLGHLHSEFGQINVPRWPHDITGNEEAFLHGGAKNPNSVEGLAAIPAIKKRYPNFKFQQLRQPEMRNHPAWHREAWYLAQLAWSVTCIVSPSFITFSGAISAVPGMLEKIQNEFEKILSDPPFPNHPQFNDVTRFIRAVGARERDGYPNTRNPGLSGLIALAAFELKTKKPYSGSSLTAVESH